MFSNLSDVDVSKTTSVGWWMQSCCMLFFQQAIPTMAPRLSNWPKLFGKASYLKAYCPKIKLPACESRSCPFWQIRVLCNSHLDFISTYCWREQLAFLPHPCPTTFSKSQELHGNILMLYSLDTREPSRICRTCSFPRALAPIKDQGSGGSRGHLLSSSSVPETSVWSHWYGENVLWAWTEELWISVCVFFSFCDILMPKV